ncbi:MAG: putative hydrogenase nickel incorporation protein HypA [Chloroflexota bacterium]|jgi:hydrogenase nickel incorporation protein HypA/HybF
MHELSVTQNLLKIALEHAEKANAKQVTALNIVIGELSSMVDDSIQLYWEAIAKGTIAEKAVLSFRRVPAELQCMTCFNKYHPKDGELICLQCGGVGAKILAGEEFFLETIDVESCPAKYGRKSPELWE